MCLAIINFVQVKSAAFNYLCHCLNPLFATINFVQSFFVTIIMIVLGYLNCCSGMLGLHLPVKLRRGAQLLSACLFAYESCSIVMMTADEVADLLHFGAEREAHETPRLSSLSAEKEITDLGLSFQSNSATDSLEAENRLNRMNSNNLGAHSSHTTPPNLRELEKGFSVNQLTELVKLIQTVRVGSGCPAAEKANENKLIDLAPRFDLKDANASWSAFEVFFDVNRVFSDELKFSIINSKLPWETMQKFGKENPNSGGDLNKLELFLKAYAKQSTPSMYHRDSFGKYGPGSLLRDVLREAKTMADLGRDERIKLNAYLLSTGSNKKIIESYMHMPVETFFAKVSQKWNQKASVKSPGDPMGHYPPRPQLPYREYYPTKQREEAIRHYSPQRPYREYYPTIPHEETTDRYPPQQPYREYYRTKPREQAMGYHSPPRAYQKYNNAAYGDRNQPMLCYYHRKFDKRAYKCERGPCTMSGLIVNSIGSQLQQQPTANSYQQPQGN